MNPNWKSKAKVLSICAITLICGVAITSAIKAPNLAPLVAALSVALYFILAPSDGDRIVINEEEPHTADERTNTTIEKENNQHLQELQTEDEKPKKNQTTIKRMNFFKLTKNKGITIILVGVGIALLSIINSTGLHNGESFLASFVASVDEMKVIIIKKDSFAESILCPIRYPLTISTILVLFGTGALLTSVKRK